MLVVTALLGACSGDVSRRRQQFLDSGNRYFEQGRFQEAILEYRNAIQLDPRFAPPRLKAAQAYVRVGNHRQALHEYVRAADLLPEDLNLQLTAGEYLLAARQADDAKARAEDVLKRQPDNVRAHVLRGNALAGTRDLTGAIAEIEEALQLDPSRGATHANLGALEFARGRRGDAEKAFRRAVELAPSWPAGHLALAYHCWVTNRVPEAEAEFQETLRLDARNIVANKAMALFLASTGRMNEAERYLKAIVDELSGGPEAALSLTDYYLQAGRPHDAMARLKPLAANPELYAEASRRLARAQAALGEYSTAHATVDAILARDPRDAGTLLLKGELLLAQRRREEALQPVKQAAAADPTSVRAMYMLGQLYAARGDVEGAVKAFTDVVKLNPSAAAAQVELARLHLLEGSAAASSRAAQQAVHAEPNNLEARLALVRSLLVEGHTRRAETEIAALLGQHPEAASVHAEAGVVAAEKKNLVAARKAFMRALELNPESVAALRGLIALDLATRRFAEATERISQKVAASPGRTDVLLLAARTYAATEDYAAAEGFLRRAIDIDSALLPAYGMLGRLYLAQRKLDQARVEFENLAERQSKPVVPLTLAGMILQAQGDTAGARQRFERALAVDPKAAIAANNLAWIYAESGDNLDTALQLAQTATEAMPESAAATDTLGWIHLKKRQPALAVGALTRSVERDSRNPVYHYHLGLAYMQAEDAAQARGALERALELKPDFPGAQDARRTLSGLSTGTTAAPR